ncbi:isoprenylcysteine carboxylmethyltransferase family protein [Duganella sp. FT135W]|uniref:Isoprenylcysteine carboxylmethyltransferase family protein n=1 Tax=Duganella flavida TaxID=2692175 RepID=A0A6L8KE40_9BURK|nr:protein-S-isoprenylcysteine O-methyltransferase [Duganella flavida]MYM25290.1 isoprenylcysteine carboxylmethyltransferase family protein [Duganella flavida]
MHHLGVFDYIFVLMIVACFLIRAPWEFRNKKAKAVESRDNAKERFNLLLVFTGSLTMPVLYLCTSWFDFANYAASPLQGVLGSVAAILGVFLFWKSHHDLGRLFSPKLEMKEAHTLVSQGIYARIRHPMYTAVFINGLAQMLLLANFVVGPAFLIAFSILYFSRIEHEEKMMLDHFGPAYAEYQQRTNRLLPAFGRRQHVSGGS